MHGRGYLGIPEILKDAAETLQELDCPGGAARTTLRQMLLPREFVLVNENGIQEYELLKLTEYIHSHCNRAYRGSNFNFYRAQYEKAWRSAWELMLSCGPDDEMYELSSVWYGGTLPKRNKLEDSRFTDHLWRTTYCSVLESMINKIETLTELRELDIDPPYQWLNSFYRKCFAYIREGNLSLSKVFPDQEGHLKSLSSFPGIRCRRRN